MRNRRRIVIGTRASRLAMAQTESVAGPLRLLQPDLDLVIEKIVTTGDREQKASLADIGGRGVFVKEIEEALLAKRIDIAVHSLKDVPTEISPGLELAAVKEREDARDALVSKSGKGLWELPPRAVIGTGSRRRAVQALALRPDLQIKDLRGNIDTRLRKAFSGDFDGVIIAAAALVRLGWQGKICEYLSPEGFLPAVGQGILGIEVRAEDEESMELAAALNHEPTWRCAIAERAFLRRLGGGCRAPIAALGVIKGDMLVLQGMAAAADGSQILRDSIEGSIEAADELGKRLAETMLERGASRFLGLDNR